MLFACSVTEFGEKWFRSSIRHQEASRLTSTIYPAIEGISGISTPCENLRRTARTQILFGPPHQFSSNSPSAELRKDHNRTDDPVVAPQPGTVCIWTKTGMRKPYDLTILAGKNHSCRVKIGLSNDQFIKLITPQPDRSASSQLALVPHPQDVRGV